MSGGDSAVSTTRLKAGVPAPEFELPGSGGNTVALSALCGSKVILYFYPAAGSPGCTTEACDFSDNLASFSTQGYRVLGVSPDPIEAIAEFARAEQLSYPLLSDTDLAVHLAYGCWGDKVVNGEEMVGPLRSTFVVDEDGIVQLAWYNVTAANHVGDLRSHLGLDEQG